MSKIETNTIDNISGSSALQIGDTNTATIGLGKSGDTINIPAGATIANAGTATGFGQTNTPYFFAYRGSSVQSIANNTLTIVEFNAELYDSGSCFDTGTYKFTPNVAGKYLINATVRMGSSTNADNCQIEIFKNTTTFSRVNGSNRNYSSIQSLATIDMNGSSDYIQAKIYQDTGGAANIQYNSDSTYQTFLQGFLIAT